MTASSRAAIARTANYSKPQPALQSHEAITGMRKLVFWALDDAAVLSAIRANPSQVAKTCPFLSAPERRALNGLHYDKMAQFAALIQTYPQLRDRAHRARWKLIFSAASGLNSAAQRRS